MNCCCFFVSFDLQLLWAACCFLSACLTIVGCFALYGCCYIFLVIVGLFVALLPCLQRVALVAAICFVTGLFCLAALVLLLYFVVAAWQFVVLVLLFAARQFTGFGLFYSGLLPLLCSSFAFFFLFSSCLHFACCCFAIFLFLPFYEPKRIHFCDLQFGRK